MNGSGLRSRLARLEARLRPRKRPRVLVWWDAGEPRPEVPPGGVLLRWVEERSLEDSPASLSSPGMVL